jgi:ribosomal protein L1
MSKHGKKYAAARERVPAGVKMEPLEALQLIKELSFAKFDETIEVATRLSVDPRMSGGTMNHRHLGQSGLVVSEISYGYWTTRT